jgi:hypothetical protein
MATKKSEAAAPQDDFKEMPSTMPEPVAPPPVVHHPLSGDQERRVAKVKADFNELIGYIKTLRDSVHDAETQRMYSVAITNAETASMWAVKAITHQG